MKKQLMSILFFALVIALTAQGNYYDAVITLSGNDLLTGLRALISTNDYSNYTGAKSFLFQTLDNTNGTVTCIYTGQVYNVGYNYNGANNPNTEHTYAQSWFSSPQSSIKKADLHHLFPSNSVVNSSRGNYPIFTVANHNSANVYYPDTPWQSYRGQSPSGYTVFEPADQSKGNIARALLYFYTRYNDTLVQQNVNMLPVLVQWSNQDPPDATERARNNGIYGFQNNRNPFVDHPEFVNRIWGPVESDDPILPPEQSLMVSSISPNPFSSQTNISLQSKSARAGTVFFYDLKGRRVRQFKINLEAGTSQLIWDGCDETGSRLPSGIYLMRVRDGNLQTGAKLLLQ